MTTVRPLRASDESVATRRAAAVESRPEVGSSRTRRLGFTSSSCPMLTRFRSPPDTPRTNALPTMVSAHGASPSSAITASAAAALAAAGEEAGRRSMAQKRSVSRTVRWGWSTSSCATNPVRRCTARHGARPPASTVPA
ncbi:hypothetical protein EE612_053829 [Oryza sativa]|nr:hypothetical protein EE612_053829 [Oryza sativa]